MFKERKEKKNVHPTMINEHEQECLLKVANGLRKIDWILKKYIEALNEIVHAKYTSSFIPN